MNISNKRNESDSKITPTVSVVLPIHNRDAYLRPAIDSILNQTLQDFELIIVNDGSSNAKCLRIIREYETQDERVQVISQENAGVAVARNTGIAAARGKYISFMDDDDISEPSYLEKQAAFLNHHKNVAAVSTLHTYIDTSDRTIGYHQPIKSIPQEPVIYMPDPNIYKNAFSIGFPRNSTLCRCISRIDPDSRKHVFQTQTWLTPRSMWRAHIMKTLKWNPLFFINQDLELSLRLMERYSTAVIPEYLYRYRMHGKHQSSLSTSPLMLHYRMASFLCALYRRQGRPEPLQEKMDVRDLVPLFKELPFPTIAFCLQRLRHHLKRMLLSQQDYWIFTLLADLDKAFLDSKHAAYYALARKQALRKLRITALKHGKFLWLISNSRQLTPPN